jgi:hypothetical protein
LIDTASDAIDIEQVLGRDAWLRAWIAQVLTLSRELVGVSSTVLAPLQDVQPQPWLRRAVLREWGTLRPTRRLPALHYLSSPALLPQVVHDRWPNPIVVALQARALPSHLPRLRQLGRLGKSVWELALGGTQQQQPACSFREEQSPRAGRRAPKGDCARSSGMA